MTETSDLAISLLDYVKAHAPELPQDDFTASEVSAIRQLAEGQREGGALERIRQLRGDFISSSDSEPRGSSPLQLNSSEKIRIEVFKRAPEARIISIKKGMVLFEAPRLSQMPVPEEGYAYKGGAARIYLDAVLGGQIKNHTPRDLDIVRVGEEHTDLDQIVAEKYMPEDVKYGHGVELVPNIRTYLLTRDLTINEVLYTHGRVICSKRALEDFLNGVLRLTQFLREREDGIPGKVITKMIRLYSEAQMSGTALRLAGIPRNAQVTPFDVVLHLDRALSRGTRAAELYLEECVKRGYVPSEVLDSGHVGDAVAFLKEKTGSKLKQFQNLSSKKPRMQPGRIQHSTKRSSADRSKKGKKGRN